MLAASLVSSVSFVVLPVDADVLSSVDDEVVLPVEPLDVLLDASEEVSVAAELSDEALLDASVDDELPDDELLDASEEDELAEDALLEELEEVLLDELLSDSSLTISGN